MERTLDSKLTILSQGGVRLYITSSLLTQGLWPILHPATRGRSRCFGPLFFKRGIWISQLTRLMRVLSFLTLCKRGFRSGCVSPRNLWGRCRESHPHVHVYTHTHTHPTLQEHTLHSPHLHTCFHTDKSRFRLFSWSRTTSMLKVSRDSADKTQNKARYCTANKTLPARVCPLHDDTPLCAQART